MPDCSKDELERFIINIHDQETMVETFTFLIGHGEKYSQEGEAATRVMEGQLRAMLRKLNAIDSQLIPLSDSGMSCITSSIVSIYA